MTKIKLTKRIHKLPKITAWIYPRRIWFCPPQQVALTFDDGPHPETTPWLLQFLKKQDIKATFFWLGENIDKYPHFVKQAITEGHTVGYHGYSHITADTLSLSKFKDNSKLPTTNHSFHYYRPPYGKINHKQAAWIEEQYKIVMWSWMAYDFDVDFSVAKILERAKKDIKGGEIVVFHENEKSKDKLKEVLSDFIKLVKEKGLIFKGVE